MQSVHLWKQTSAEPKTRAALFKCALSSLVLTATSLSLSWLGTIKTEHPSCSESKRENKRERAAAFADGVVESLEHERFIVSCFDPLSGRGI